MRWTETEPRPLPPMPRPVAATVDVVFEVFARRDQRNPATEESLGLYADSGRAHRRATLAMREHGRMSHAWVVTRAVIQE